MGSSWTRARTRVPCIGRWILNHCATREAHFVFLESTTSFAICSAMHPMTGTRPCSLLNRCWMSEYSLLFLSELLPGFLILREVIAHEMYGSVSLAAPSCIPQHHDLTTPAVVPLPWNHHPVLELSVHSSTSPPLDHKPQEGRGYVLPLWILRAQHSTGTKSVVSNYLLHMCMHAYMHEWMNEQSIQRQLSWVLQKTTVSLSPPSLHSINIPYSSDFQTCLHIETTLG